MLARASKGWKDRAEWGGQGVARRVRVEASRGGEMADTEDLKSSGPKGPCGFESRPRHQPLRNRVFGRLHGPVAPNVPAG